MNSIDFLTCEKINKIPHAEFYSYKSILDESIWGFNIISFYNSRSVHNQCLGWVLSTQRYQPPGMADTTNTTRFRWFIALRSNHRLQTVPRSNNKQLASASILFGFRIPSPWSDFKDFEVKGRWFSENPAKRSFSKLQSVPICSW